MNNELRRKILHILIGILILVMAVYIIQIKWILFYVLLISIILSILSLFFKIPLINILLDNFERPYYRKIFPGKGFLFFIAGSLLVLKLFPKEIALASIAILTFSDPLFSFDKRVFSKMFKSKGLISLLLGLAAGIIASSIFIPFYQALIATFFSALAESLSIYLGGDPVDDNIIMPLAAGTILYVLFIL